MCVGGGVCVPGRSVCVCVGGGCVYQVGVCSKFVSRILINLHK